MDRRRLLLIGFVVLAVVAIGDVYINGFGMFEQFARGFSITFESQEPKMSVTLEADYDALAVDRLVMDGRGDRVDVRGESTDRVIIEAVVNVFAQEMSDALAYVDGGLDIDPVVEGGVLRPRLNEGSRRRVKATDVHWTIIVPEELTVEVSNSLGTVDIQDVQAPVTATTSGMVSITNAGDPLRIVNQGGMVKVQGVPGDASVENAMGTVQIENVAGDLDLKSSMSDVRVHNIGGEVVADGSFGMMEFTQVSGMLDVRQGMGAVAIRDARGPITLSVDTGAATIQPEVADRITATVTTGDLRLDIPRDLVNAYEFDLKVGQGELTQAPETKSAVPLEEGDAERYAVKATVTTGDLAVAVVD